jgi:hypothetical protein
MYELKRKWQRHVITTVITDLDGNAKRVSLTDKAVESVVPATAKAPEYTAIIPAITQAEIENLIKTGHPLGERFQKKFAVAKPNGEPITTKAEK